MLEDDVIALDAWYHQTQEALERVEEQSMSKGGTWDCKNSSKETLELN